MNQRYLTRNTIFKCCHMGTIKFIVPSPLHHSQDGAKIVTREDLIQRAIIIGCPAAPKPCTKVVDVFPPALSRLMKVDGETPVLEIIKMLGPAGSLTDGPLGFVIWLATMQDTGDEELVAIPWMKPSWKDHQQKAKWVGLASVEVPPIKPVPLPDLSAPLAERPPPPPPPRREPITNDMAVMVEDIDRAQAAEAPPGDGRVFRPYSE